MKATIFIKKEEDITTTSKLQKSGILFNDYHYFGKLWGTHQIDDALHQKVIEVNKESILDWLKSLGYNPVAEEDNP